MISYKHSRNKHKRKAAKNRLPKFIRSHNKTMEGFRQVFGNLGGSDDAVSDSWKRGHGSGHTQSKRTSVYIFWNLYMDGRLKKSA